jgi:cbb3-type cytochrome oxidase subunit 3
MSIEAFAAAYAPFFFISYGVIWFAYTIYDAIKKNKR